MNFQLIRYRIRHAMFKWTQDADGDICFRVCGLLHFIKYKEHTIIKVGFHAMDDAPKYVGNNS